MKRTWLWFICFAALVTSCSSTKEYVLYEGLRLSKEKVAVLYTPPENNVRLFGINQHKSKSINGFGYVWGDSFIMELLPGDYVLEVGYREFDGTTV